jgi:phytoene synthase
MISSNVTIQQSYEECRLITKREARNFYYAFITLPARKRLAIYAAYAFCRYCDDAVDEESDIEDKLKALSDLRRRLSDAYNNKTSDSVFTALADSASAYDIPQEYFDEVINGVEMDLTKDRYRNFDELRTYCYRVASAVGLICIHIFGFKHPKAKDYAIDLGLAMQLTNILRDVGEDLKRGRIYIPQDEMERFGYGEDDLKRNVLNESQQQLMSFQAQRARGYFISGMKLMPYLSFRSRACPAVLAQLYSRVLDRIESKGYNVFDGKISLSGREKALLTVTTWLRSLLPQPLTT